MNYLCNKEDSVKQMLEALSIESVEQLFDTVPKDEYKTSLELPNGISEAELIRHFAKLGKKNRHYDAIYRGAGAENHYIPSIVPAVADREEFLTAYTPYQPEISQGILQSIFEYQSLICRLTDMQASNASVYDGATAAAEACIMCLEKKHTAIVISDTIKPENAEVIKTYAYGRGIEVRVATSQGGKTQLADIASDVAAVYFEQPNRYGVIEDAPALVEAIHAAGTKAIMGVHPHAAALLKSPGECGADIAVGEAQPLGMPMAFGGPYLGFMATTAKLARKLPGRIVGETVDRNGDKAYVLTLQAREQHIRREKAGSNICSNQANCALRAAIFMASVGGDGLRQLTINGYSLAHYAKEKLCAINGIDAVFSEDFLFEFLTKSHNDDKILDVLRENNILGGHKTEQGILWCFTEMNTAEEIDRLVELVGGAV